MAATYYLCPIATIFQYFTDAGIVLSGGKINTYLAGTSTRTPTYTDDTGNTPNGNPIILASNGRLPNVSIWQPGGVALKIIITDANNNLLGPTFDQITGINDLVLADSALSNPASGSGADLVANAMRSYDIFSSARAANVPILQSGQTLIVDFEGGITVADGLGGEFYWNATSTAADDNLNILRPTSLSGPGRYLRLDQHIRFYAVKGAGTSRALTTTVSSDPDLQIALPQGGTYIIQGWFNDSLATSPGGLKGQIAYSGALTNGYWGMSGNGTAVTPVALTNINTTAQLQSAQTGVGTMPIFGALLCTASGILSFNWAQQSSNGAGSVVGAGSFLTATRVSSATGGFNPLVRLYGTAGSGVETVPVGATTMTVEVFGGSGAGGFGTGSGCVTHAAGGGGSGGYCKTTINVASFNGQTMNYTVGTTGVYPGGFAGASLVTSGTLTIASMTANGGDGGASGPSGGAGGPGGTASGGNVTNTPGNVGHPGGLNVIGGNGGAGIVGINATGPVGGKGGSTAVATGFPGGPGIVVFSYV